jgi:sterol desaturase/sphingolipid hydroxylase (fatty acid hydroxylase superfamily)
VTDFQQILADLVYYLVFNLTRALTAFRQRESFLYWPFLVSTLGIALALWLYRIRSTKGFVGEYFSRRLWWHRSARVDYKLYVLNGVVLPGVFGVLLFNEAHLLALVQSWFAGGDAAVAGATHDVAAKIAYTVVFFIALDLGRFISHCLLHDVPLLWEFHKVHHSAEVLTPLTSYRAHPVELVLMAWGPVLITAVATFLFQKLFPGTVGFYTFLGLHVLVWISNLVGNLRHSPVWLSYGPSLGRWLISPAHHQLHHSCDPRHIGCNRGFELAIWDRFYGTLFVPESRPQPLKLGFGDGSESRYNSIAGMYLLPFTLAFQQLRRLFARVARPPAI